MPADWDKPTLTSPYADVLDFLAEKDLDAVSLFETDGSNIPDTAMKYVRASNKFQERVAGAWVDKVISLAGGGTGGATAASARTNLGLGTIATQDANNVTITGGSLAGVGTGLTALNASALASGTVPDARFPATLPALNGSALTNLNASALATGTVNQARLGSGGGGATKFLREDNTWQEVSLGPVTAYAEVQIDAGDLFEVQNIDEVPDVGAAYIIPLTGLIRVKGTVGFPVSMYFSDNAGVQITSGAAEYITARQQFGNNTDTDDQVYKCVIVSWE